MNLGKLLESLPQKEVIAEGSADKEITAVVYASNEIEPGSLFVAVVGFHTDGHRFIADAAKRGATAIVGSNREKLSEFVNSPEYKGAAVIWVEDERAALNHLAAAFYNY